MNRITPKNTFFNLSIFQLFLSIIFLSIFALPASSINPDKIDKGSLTLPKSPAPPPLPQPLPTAPPPSNPVSAPAPVTPQAYYPPKSYDPAPSPAPARQSLPHDVVGCDNKGHSKLIRQIRLGEVVHCVLGEDSFRKDGRPIHMYEFQGTADQALAIKLIGGKSGDWQLNPYLVVLGPDRRVISADDNTSRQRIAQVQVKLPTNGTYTILASNREAKESGRYSIVVERDPNRYSLDESRELSDRSQRLTQDNSAFNPSEFQGEQGKVVTIRASSYSFFPALILLDPDGQIIARNDNKAGKRNVALEYRLPKSGTYKAIVNSIRPEDRGNYRLTISPFTQGR